MSFNQLITDVHFGIKRNISSRRDKIRVTPEEFRELASKYFNSIERDNNLLIKCAQEDKGTLIFLLRWYYQLWVDINKDVVLVHFSFPKEFVVVQEVNKMNHPFTPKVFAKGTILYFNGTSYSTCNWLRGIPLWDNKSDITPPDISPRCQINYDFIKVYIPKNDPKK